MNDEQNVLDAIDALEADAIDDLVDWQLSNYANRSGYDHDVNQVACDLCGGDFHGLPKYGCPGAACTDEERQAYTTRQPARRNAPWTLSDVESTRGGFSRQQPRPRVRFWATGEDGMLHEIEGTLHLQPSDHVYPVGQLTFQATLLPPIIQRQVPSREQSMHQALGEVLRDADLTTTCQTWVPGEEQTQEAQPVGTVESGLISIEAALSPGAGFEPVGSINEDDLVISHDQDFVRDWGGRTVRTTSNYTVSFTTPEGSGPAWSALFGTNSWNRNVFRGPSNPNQ